MSDRYPILVERLRPEQALVVHCQRCRWEATIGPDDIRNERNYSCPACGSPADFKYEEADHKCPSCGKLGFFPDAVKPCCSRVCKLQAEYVAELARRRSDELLALERGT